MKNLASIIIALVVAPAVASAHVMDAQKFFDVETKRRCPSHHLEWLGDGSYDEVLQAYEAGLPKNLRHKIDKISDYSHKCSDVRSGFYCL